MGFNGLGQHLPFQHHSDSNTAAKLAHCWPLLDGFNTGNISKLQGSGDRNVPFRLWAGSVLGTIQITEKPEPSIYHISSEEIALSQNTPKKESVMADSSFHRSNSLERFRSLRITFQSAEDIPNVVMILSKGM